VVDLSEGAREARLEELCSGDSELRAFVERLLRHHETGGGGVLDRPPSVGDTETTEPAPISGETLGPYVLRERIGSGGMGEVWRAEQTTPVRRTVALKLIKAGMDSGQVIARFEAERQALALMDHPAIAKVFDAGTTHQGRPYFAMEYVPGVPITEYCDSRKLGTRERLELFQRVCEGVQHAHQKAVIHRDLKPSNILVADVDGKPQPRIIDFGVAKATTQKLTEKTMYTAMGQLIGTPEYMSPEQANLTVEDIDTRSDVYSLGVILYELLAGALPFEPTELRKAGFEGILRLLREKDPPRPSTKVSSLGERTTEVAANRRTEPRRLVSQLRGDLDWIVMRSLEKDRNRRYASPQELAQDIGRHLQHEPVLAGPPSPIYRARKFLRRHRGNAIFAGSVIVLLMVLGAIFAAFGFMTVLVVVLVAFGITMSVMFGAQRAERMRADRERDRAVREAETTAQVTATLEEMLASVDPTKSGRDVTVKEMLDQTAKTLGVDFKARPLVEASLRHTVGMTYEALGEYDDAEQHLRRAVEIRRELLGEEDPRTLEAMAGLAGVYRQQAGYQEAEALAREALKTARRVLGEEHPQTLALMQELAASYWVQGRYASYWVPSRYKEAESLFREILETSRRVLGEEHPQTLLAMTGLANTYQIQERLDEAEALQRETLEIQRRVLGEEHPQTLMNMSNLGFAYWRHGRYVDAEPLLRKTLEIQRRVLGEEHPETPHTMGALALTYGDEGKYEEAMALQHETLETSRRVLGEEHPQTLRSLEDLAYIYGLQDRRGEAEVLRREILEISRRVLGEENPQTAVAMNNLALCYRFQGRYDEAEALLGETIELRRRVIGEGHPQTLRTKDYLAYTYSHHGRNVEAETLARETMETSRRVLGEEHLQTLRSMLALADAYSNQGRNDEAEILYRKNLEISRRVFGEELPHTLTIMSNLAHSCLKLGRHDEAETLWREELEIQRRILGDGHAQTNKTRYNLACALAMQRRRNEAISILREALDNGYNGPDGSWSWTRDDALCANMDETPAPM
jgi:serine/threonine protein kinase/tetratricopeptide (TPR) repeat protein